MTDPILERVRKLLTKAEDPGCTPEESAALNDKAAELIAKYGVDRAMLAAARPESDIVGDRTLAVNAPYALDKTGLLGTIARASALPQCPHQAVGRRRLRLCDAPVRV